MTPCGGQTSSAASEDPGPLTWAGGNTPSGYGQLVAVAGIMPLVAHPRAFGAII